MDYRCVYVRHLVDAIWNMTTMNSYINTFPKGRISDPTHSSRCLVMTLVSVWLFTHAGIANGIGRAFSLVCLFVCLFVRALKGKRLELSTQNLVHVYSMAVAWHALTQILKSQRLRSHGYENRHGRSVASDHGPYSAYKYAVLYVAVVGVGLHVDTTAYVSSFILRLLSQYHMFHWVT